MKSTDFNHRRIAEGYQSRPCLHTQVIEQFRQDTGCRQFSLGLDVGCGAGLSTRALKAICTAVIGTDISPEMIRAAREACGAMEGISFAVCSAEEPPPLPESVPYEGAVDIVTAAGVIPWTDRVLFLSNMNRLVRGDGYLLIYDFAISDIMIGNPAYTEWWHRQYLCAFPKPHRSESVWNQEDVAPYGFDMTARIELNMEHTFALDDFIQFMMIQSNVNARIEGGEQTEEEARRWFGKTLSPIFQNQTQRLLFRGYSWYLRRRAETGRRAL